jgi:hypothetical protein
MKKKIPALRKLSSSLETLITLYLKDKPYYGLRDSLYQLRAWIYTESKKMEKK